MKALDPVSTAEDLAQLESEFIEEYRHELLAEVPRLEGYARLALERPKERFNGEKAIARTVLTKDTPERVRWLSAAISFLENAPVRGRYEFITADYSKQKEIVERLLNAYGFNDRHGRWAWFR